MDDTRQRLLDAAGQTFAEKGFDAATVREICGRAQANIAAVNYHFGDKTGLYIAAVTQAHCHRGELPQFPWTEATAPEQKLEDFIRDMMTMMLDEEGPSWHLELMMREMARPTVACAELVKNFIGPMFDMLLSIIGELLPRATSAEKQLHAFSVIGQCLLYRFHRAVGRLLLSEEEHQAVWQCERLTQQITRFSLAGIRSGQVGAETNP